MYIQSVSGVTYQNTFSEDGFLNTIIPINDSSEIIHPSYTEFIPAMTLRRMNDAVKMASHSALSCIKQVKNNIPEAIIVGTAHGCPKSTLKFLNSIYKQNGKLLSPTPFTLSTHNTISGQISLLTINRGYNITHTQSSLSFEYALLDAQLQFQEGANNILVGSSDELAEPLYDIKLRLKNNDILSGYGSTFFFLSKEPKDAILIKDIDAIGLVENISLSLNNFLNKNNLTVDNLDAVYYSSSNKKSEQNILKIFKNIGVVNIHKYCKSYLTNSSFGLHLAKKEMEAFNHKYALIFNNILDENLGLTLIENRK